MAKKIILTLLLPIVYLFLGGLGSSSVVVLGALYAAYVMAGVEISKRDLLNKAIVYERHPDNVAPATHGGFCSSVIQKGRVITINKSLPSSIKALVVVPPRAMSTKQARSVLPTQYAKENVVFNLSRVSLMSASFMSENWELLRFAAYDQIHENHRMNTYKDLFHIRKVIQRQKPLMATLSGSGSTIFSMFYANEVDEARVQIANQLPSDFKVMVCDFNNTGVRVSKREQI